MQKICLFSHAMNASKIRIKTRGELINVVNITQYYKANQAAVFSITAYDPEKMLSSDDIY